MDVFRGFRVAVQRHLSSPKDLIERWYELLIDCAPAGARGLLKRHEDCLIVAPDGPTARLIRANGNSEAVLGVVDSKVSGSLRTFLAAMNNRGFKIVLRLPDDQVLTRKVDLPIHARNNLVQVLRYEIDRLSPFKLEEVLLDYRSLNSPPQQHGIRVEFALCRRDGVQEWLERLREAGAWVDQVTWEHAWSKANLLPAEGRPARSLPRLSLNKVLLLTLLVLVGVSLATPIWQMQQVRNQREQQLTGLKVRAQELQDIRSSLERARQGSVALLQRKWEQPRMIDLILELTRRLPDDTWVQNLDYGDGELKIRGESAQATALIDLLDQAPGITEVKFLSPVVQVAGTGQERFHISLKYRREKAP